MSHNSMFFVQFNFLLSLSSTFQAFSWGFHSVCVCEGHLEQDMLSRCGNPNCDLWFTEEALSASYRRKKNTEISKGFSKLTNAEKWNRFAAFSAEVVQKYCFYSHSDAHLLWPVKTTPQGFFFSFLTVLNLVFSTWTMSPHSHRPLLWSFFIHLTKQKITL